MLAKNAPETAPINRSISRLTQRDNLVMLKLFRTAYCVIKHNFLLRSFPVLITLQECNGLPLGHAYRNSVAACTFLHSISYVLQNDIVNDLKSADYYSPLLDGSTDVTVHEQEIMYVRILKDGKPHNIFLGLMFLPSGSAEGISSGLHSFFSDMGFLNWKEKLVSLGTEIQSENFDPDLIEAKLQAIHDFIMPLSQRNKELREKVTELYDEIKKLKLEIQELREKFTHLEGDKDSILIGVIVKKAEEIIAGSYHQPLSMKSTKCGPAPHFKRA